MSGTMDIVIAGGVESMSRVPMGLPLTLPMKVYPLSISYNRTEYINFNTI